MTTLSEIKINQFVLLEGGIFPDGLIVQITSINQDKFTAVGPAAETYSLDSKYFKFSLVNIPRDSLNFRQNDPSYDFIARQGKESFEELVNIILQA
ncbi:hypothetical protein [Rothia sp. 88186D007BW]